MRNALGLLIGSVMAVSTPLFSGCSQSGTDKSDDSVSLAPMWKMEFDQTLRLDSITEFERSVLEDYLMDVEEWQNAHQLLYECINLHSLEGDDVLAKLDAGIEQAHECANGTVREVGVLYAGPPANAAGLELLDLIRACLYAAGFGDISQVTDETLLNGQSDPQFQTNPEFYRCVTEPSVKALNNIQDIAGMQVLNKVISPQIFKPV